MSGQTQIIEVESPYQKLLEEVIILKARLATVMEERDDLRDHICREIQAEYDEKVGKLELEAMEIEIQIRARRMTLEFMQAQVNRDQEPSYEEARRRTDEKTNQYYEDLNQRAERARQDEEYVRRRRKQDEWNEQHAGENSNAGGSGTEDTGESDQKATFGGGRAESGRQAGDSGADGYEDGRGEDGNDGSDNTGQDKSRDGDDPEVKKMSPSQELKYLYRKIMKKLHPDANPDATKEENEMLLRAQTAFAEGDLETLREIAEKIEDEDIEERFEDTAEDIEKLMKYRDQLKDQIWSAEHDIEDIKDSFPYNAKEFLADEDAVRERRAELIRYIHEFEEQIKELDERIERLRQDFENRQQKCG